MLRLEHSKIEFIKYVILACIISVINILFYTDPLVGYVTIILEILMLLYAFVKNDLAEYIALYMIFLSNCIEYTSFAGIETNFYNLKDVRVLGFNLGAWLLIPPVLKVIVKPIRIGYLENKQRDFYKMGIGLIKINVVAFIVGALLVLFNDNGIRGLESLEREYVGMIYSMLYIPLAMFLIFSFILTKTEEKLNKIVYALQGTMYASAFQMVIALLTHTYGYYGGVDTLLTSTLVFIMPLFLLLFLGKEQVMFPKFTLLVAIVGTVLGLVYNANGKMIIIAGMVCCIVIWKLLSNKSVWIKVLSVFFSVVLVAIIPLLIDHFVESSIIFQSKFNEVIRLFDFGNDWINNLPESPRIRIEEYLNILIEYLNKPWLIITGKGYLGSIIDHTGYFEQIVIKEGAFQDSEWANGTFFKLHEMAQILIMYGLMGILYYFYLFKIAMRREKKNIWILLGVIWFFLLYGYSFTLSVYGFVMLFYGLSNVRGYQKNANGNNTKN